MEPEEESRDGIDVGLGRAREESQVGGKGGFDEVQDEIGAQEC